MATDATPRPGGREGEIGLDLLIFGLFVVGWIVLQHVVLPRLGVPT